MLILVYTTFFSNTLLVTPSFSFIHQNYQQLCYTHLSLYVGNFTPGEIKLIQRDLGIFQISEIPNPQGVKSAERDRLHPFLVLFKRHDGCNLMTESKKFITTKIILCLSYSTCNHKQWHLIVSATISIIINKGL